MHIYNMALTWILNIDIKIIQIYNNENIWFFGKNFFNISLKAS